MARLIAEGKRVPVFTLRDGAGNDIRLESFLKRRRVLLVFLSAREEGDCCRAWLKEARGRARDLAERDMTVLVVAPEPATVAEAQNLPEPFVVLSDSRGEVVSAFGGVPAFYLVGKDGTVKRSARECLPLAEIFRQIDTLPLRRQEMQQSAKAVQRISTG